MTIKSIMSVMTLSIIIASVSHAAENEVIKDLDISFSENARLYYSYRGDAMPDIFVLRNNKEINLTNSPERVEFEPSFSPDGKYITFSSGANMSDIELRIMDADGNNERVFYNGPAMELGSTWSPDGSLVLFSIFDRSTDRGTIHVVDRLGKNMKSLTHDLKGSHHGPSWSNDGKHILFVNDLGEGSQENIYRINVDGSQVTQLTHTDNSKRNPRYTPNGKVIVYSGGDDGVNHLFALSAENPGKSGKGTKLTFNKDKSDYFINFTTNGVHMTYSSGNWGNGFKMEHLPIPHVN